MDFVVPLGGDLLLLAEAKASRTATPAAAAPLTRLAKAAVRYRTESFVVHRTSASGPGTTALSPGVRAVSLKAFLERLHADRRAAG